MTDGTRYEGDTRIGTAPQDGLVAPANLRDRTYVGVAGEIEPDTLVVHRFWWGDSLRPPDAVEAFRCRLARTGWSLVSGTLAVHNRNAKLEARDLSGCTTVMLKVRDGHASVECRQRRALDGFRVPVVVRRVTFSDPVAAWRDLLTYMGVARVADDPVKLFLTRMRRT